MGCGIEAWKLVPLLVHFTFSLGSVGAVVPNAATFMERLGVNSSSDIANISDVVSSACASCIEMHKALDAKSMNYEDHHRVLYLISVAKYHHIRLQVLKTVCWMLRKKERTTPSVINELFKNGVKGNKHHLMFHLLLAKLELGCDLIAVDSEMSEQSHKPFVKDAFNNSSKRLSSRLKEMMQYVMKKKLIAYLKDLLTQLEGTGVAHVAPALPDQIEVEYKVDESYRLYFFTYSNVFLILNRYFMIYIKA
jgi:hypothetical protein